MELDRALHQISEIHGHLARSEVYRGYRSFPVGLGGLLVVGAAALQDALLPPFDGLAFVRYWVAVAVVAGAASGAHLVWNYLLRDDAFARRRTRRVVGQFVPCLAAGAVVTFSLAHNPGLGVGLIPGLWAVLLALGIFSSRPYLPRAIGWVGLYYLGAGGALLASTSPDVSLRPWSMAATFGVGQLLAAVVLYWNIERHEHGQTA